LEEMKARTPISTVFLSRLSEVVLLEEMKARMPISTVSSSGGSSSIFGFVGAGVSKHTHAARLLLLWQLFDYDSSARFGRHLSCVAALRQERYWPLSYSSLVFSDFCSAATLLMHLGTPSMSLAPFTMLSPFSADHDTSAECQRC
jgi:hypothetical protein